MSEEIDPKIELHINNKLKEHREKSDNSYAMKLVEKVVFYAMAAIGLAVLSALIKIIII